MTNASGRDTGAQVRRLLDVTLAAVAAAALLALVQAWPLLADFVVYPKSWSIGEKLNATDLNAQFAAVPAAVNGNLDTSNLKAAANIKGSQLAAAAGITGMQLAGSATTPTVVRDPEPPTTSWSTPVTTGADQTIRSTVITTVHGSVVLVLVTIQATTSDPVALGALVDGVTLSRTAVYGPPIGAIAGATIVGIATGLTVGAHTVTVVGHCVSQPGCATITGRTQLLELS